MDIDSIQPSPPTKLVERPPVKITSRQAVTGLTPPQRAEAIVREVRPSVADHPAVSGPAQMLMQTGFLAPLGWLMLAPLFPLKFLPFVCKRYTLTNRRLMIRRGLARPRPIQEVALADIDDVRVDPSRHAFYRSGTLEILSQGKTVLHLPGVAAAGGVPPQHSRRRARLGARQGAGSLHPGERQAEQLMSGEWRVASGEKRQIAFLHLPVAFVLHSSLATRH